MNTNRPTPARADASRGWRIDALVALGVFAVALLLRLTFLFAAQDRHWPHAVFYEGDAVTWVEFADAIHNQQQRNEVPFEQGLPLRSPGVAYAMHWLQDGPPWNLLAMKVVWSVAGAAACALAYLCFVASANRRTALLAAAMCVFSFGLTVTSTSLNNEGLYTPLLMLIVWLTLRLAARPAWWLVVIAGLLNGVATLLRAEHSLLLLLMTAYLLWRWRRETPAWGRGFPKHGRGALAVVAMIGVSIAPCLPWSVAGNRAIAKLNTDAPAIPYSRSPIPWSEDARAFLETLPGFTREATFVQMTRETQQAGGVQVTADGMRELLKRNYGYIPEPLHTPVFVSNQGPLSFALANHPDSDGGFSKAALALPGVDNPQLFIAAPQHLKLLNHGYAVGMEYITHDVGGWLRLVGKKLSRFADGVALGFGGRNWPIGRAGVRRPVDIITPQRGQAVVWRVAFLLLIAVGAGIAAWRRTGGVWMVVIAYKLAVTVLFYGYARQAVSVLPAFFFFAALPIDALLARIERWKPTAARRQAQIACALLALAIAVDVWATVTAAPMRADGPLDRYENRWGEGPSFESAQEIHLRPRDRANAADS